ncbi:MAG: PIN domain protein, partial [candidate division NC10 bacterium]
MRLYLDLNCFNRPFDDQNQERIRRETGAILAILARIVERSDVLVWSWALDWENARHPIADRREEIG